MFLSIVTASAFSTGFDPNPSEGVFDCGQCHNQTGSFLDLAPEADRPIVQLVRLDDQPLEVGSRHRLRLTVETAHDPAGRRLGFGMAVIPQVGADLITRPGRLWSASSGVRLAGVLETDLTHASPQVYVDGRVQLEVEMELDATGDHAVYVVANDVDGDGGPSRGDFVWPVRFCFSTNGGAPGVGCDAALGSAPESEDTGADQEPVPAARGCWTSGGGVGGFGLLLLPWCRRRGPIRSTRPSDEGPA